MKTEEKKIEKIYHQAEECPITVFMEQIGGKWKPVIIWILLLNEVCLLYTSPSPRDRG